MIVRVGALLLLVILVARLSRGAMWVAFSVGALAAGPSLGMRLCESLDAVLRGAASEATIRLVLFVESIILLSRLMKRMGALDRLGETVRATLGGKAGVVALPALVGLLPMPGGALFSAPLVDVAASGSSLSPARRAVANYWFRHAWEFWWPLYPGVIAAVELSGVPWPAWTLSVLWLTPVAALAGWAVILRDQTLHAPARGRPLGPLFEEIVPILIVPSVALVSHALFALVPSLRVEGTWLLFGAVWVSIAYVLRRARGRRRLLLEAFERRMLGMACLVVSLMAYREVITASGMAQALAREFSHARVSPLAIASSIACVGGLVTGIAVGFVGSTFPILAPFLQGTQLHFGLAMAIAYVWGWAGMMLSPLHLCFVVTREHFRAEWTRLYALLLPLTALICAAGTFGLLALASPDGDAHPPSSRLVATIRAHGRDRVVTVDLARCARTAVPRRAAQQRWPAWGPEGRLAYLEGDRLWRLVLREPDGQTRTVADSLAGDRPWVAWSRRGALAASCVSLASGRCLLLGHPGGTLGPVEETHGARCPFWQADTLWCFLPRPHGWVLARVTPGPRGPSPRWTLPPLDPVEAAVSPQGSVIAYLAEERTQQPPRRCLVFVDLARGAIHQAGEPDADYGAVAWDGETAVSFCRIGRAGCILRVAPDGTASPLGEVPLRLVGARIIPREKVIAGCVRRPKGGFDLAVVRWDGSQVCRVSARGDFWGLQTHE